MFIINDKISGQNEEENGPIVNKDKMKIEIYKLGIKMTEDVATMLCRIVLMKSFLFLLHAPTLHSRFHSYNCDSPIELNESIVLYKLLKKLSLHLHNSRVLEKRDHSVALFLSIRRNK